MSKRAFAWAAVLGSWLALGAQARAAAPPSPPPPLPPPVSIPPAPPAVPPPPPAFVPYSGGPSAAQLDALEAAGHHRRRVGALWMAAGGALTLVGAGLTIAGAWDHDEHACNGYYYNGTYYNGGGYAYAGGTYYYYGDGSYHHHCGSSALTIAGVGTSFVGVAAFVPGVLLYGEGSRAVNLARRLRSRGAGWCWRPTLSPSGAGVQLELAR